LLAGALQARVQDCADRLLAAAAQRIEALLRNRDTAGAAGLMQETDWIAGLARPEQKSEWQNRTSRWSRKGLHGRV